MVNWNKARAFVFRQGTLFERALYAWLFDNGSLEHLQRCIASYKNADGGYGHGFEHDLKAPQSNPLALEYLLTVMRHCDIPPGDLLVGCSGWIERAMDADGKLHNPPQTRDYPLAPWWQDAGGQTMPDSIVANLHHFGCASPSLLDKTKRWVLANASPAKIRENEWLFMAYHAYDFFFTVDSLPNVQAFQQATIENILACAALAPENQLASIFSFATHPDSRIAQALPAQFLERCLQHVATSQQAEGHWQDQHKLPQWYPISTIQALLALRRYGRA